MAIKFFSRHALSVLSLSFLVACVSSFPTRPGSTGGVLTWEVEGDPPGKLDCASDRSSDYYGLGVRLGVYLTWLTAWVANISVPDEIGGALDQNSIFMFGLLIALGRCAITGLLSSMDGLMLMHLAGGSLFSVLTVWGYRTCLYRNEGPKAIQHFGGFGTHMRMLLSLAVSIIGLWFWNIGILRTLPKPTDLDPKHNPICDDIHTFFFGKLNARAGIRIYYIVICIGCTIYFGLMTMVSVITPVTRLLKMQRLLRSRYFRTTSRLKYATGLNYHQLKWAFYVLSIGNLFWIIFSIVMCEMTLNYNHIQGVLGANGRIFFPSQLLPFIIGLCSFIRIVYLRIELWRSPDDILPSLPERPSIPLPVARPHGQNWFRLFSPPRTTKHAIIKENRKELQDTDLDADMIGQPTWWRYLVTYLPWLQAASYWFKRESIHSDMLEASEGDNEKEERLKQDLKGDGKPGSDIRQRLRSKSQ